MNLTFFPDGERVDEVLVENAAVLLSRSGVSRYRLRVESRTEALELEIWTAPHEQLVVDTDEPPPPWGSVQRAPDVAVAVVRALDVIVHLEHMDRGYYWLGVSRIDSWAIRFRSKESVKSRVLASSGSRSSETSPGHLCDGCGAFVLDFSEHYEALVRARQAAWNKQLSLAAAELMSVTGCSAPEAETWTRHAGRPGRSRPGPPCPFCHTPLPTSRSQQCLRCKADWHLPVVTAP